MEYFKIHLDEDDNYMAFFEYRKLEKGVKHPMLRKAFPLDIIGEEEPRLLELVEGEITDIYYEERAGDALASEVKEINVVVGTLDESDVTYLKDLTKRACIEEEYDSLIAPPTVDQQVEDFIKEFFENDDEEPLEQKDFLAEFFAELEEDGS